MSLQFDANARFLWAEESTAGTDAVEPNLSDDAHDLVWQEVRSMSVNPQLDGVESPPRTRGSHSGTRHNPVKTHTEGDIEIPFLGQADATNQVVRAAPLLKAANLQEDLSTASENKYTPGTLGSSATVYKYIRNVENADWRLYALTNFVWSFTINASRGDEAFLSGSYQADYEKIRDSAAYIDSNGSISLLKDGSTSAADHAAGTGSESHADQTPMMPEGMTLTVGGDALDVDEFTMDVGWDMDTIDVVSGDPTHKKRFNTRSPGGGRIQGGMNLLDASESSFNAIRDAQESGTELALAVTLTDGTRSIDITANDLQVGVLAEGANGNLKSYQVPFFLNGDWSTLGADNDFEIRYY